MKIVDVHFYYLGQKKDDPRFRNLLAQKANWTPEQMDEFLSKNDSAIFKKKRVNEAVDLVREFQQVGVIGAINGLANVPYYTKQFRKFLENNGRFRLTWNWASPIFNWIWQPCRGLWAKWLLYGLVSTLLSWSFLFYPTQMLGMTGMIIFSLVLWIGEFCFYGSVSNYDYFLKKTQDENFWPTLPYKRYKTPFWILILIAVCIGAVFFGLQTKSVISMQRQMINPTISQGEKIQFAGVEFVPLPGWRVISGFPGNFQPSFFGNYQTKPMLFLIMGIQPTKEQDQRKAQSETDKVFGVLSLWVYTPKGKTLFHSLDQKEVQEIIEPIAKGFNHAMFKLMLKDSQTSEPIFMEVNGQKWAKIVTSLQFRGAPPEATFLNGVYYTVAGNRLIILYLQGSLEAKEAEKKIEQFLQTFKFSNAV